MTINFTEQELEWIDKKPFNWIVKNNCPDKLKKSIKRKLDTLYTKKQGVVNNGTNKYEKHNR